MAFADVGSMRVFKATQHSQAAHCRYSRLLSARYIVGLQQVPHAWRRQGNAEVAEEAWCPPPNIESVAGAVADLPSLLRQLLLPLAAAAREAQEPLGLLLTVLRSRAGQEGQQARLWQDVTVHSTVTSGNSTHPRRAMPVGSLPRAPSRVPLHSPGG